MNRVLGLLAVGACLSISATLDAQEPRPFCDPNGPTLCVPDVLSVVFPPEGSAPDDGTPMDSTTMVAAGETLSARVMFIAVSPLVQGWSYGLRHDPAVLTLDAVTTAGTHADPTHPDGIAIQPMFDVTQSVREQDNDPEVGPFVGFISAVVLAFIADTQLPLGREPICNMTYTVAADPGQPGSMITFVDNELGAPNSPPVAVNITVNGTAALPETLIDGVVMGMGGGVEICDNGTDDDGDGDVDCDDTDCSDDPACPEDCTNGVDDDADGDVDCADSECAGQPGCVEICDNGTDDDGDGLVDCADVEDCPANMPPCDQMGKCPNWGFVFGASLSDLAVPAGADDFAISMSNIGEAFAFSLGVARAANGAYTFSSALGTDNTRLVELIVTDSEGNTQDAVGANMATSDGRAPTQILRGSALTAFDPGDFFAFDLEPGVGGPGFTVGYVSDLDDDVNRIPATSGGETCSLNEILRVSFVPIGKGNERFSRGDADGNGRINITDAVLIIQVILGNLPERMDCDDALDANDDNSLNISDAMPVLAWIFQAGPRLPDPFLACGQDGNPGCNEASAFCAN